MGWGALLALGLLPAGILLLAVAVYLLTREEGER